MPFSFTPPGSVAEQCVRKFFGHERLQILDLLAHADEVHRNRALARDRGENAALRGAVELGDDQAGETERVIERLHLRECILARVRVDHEQHFVRRAVEGLADHALDLLELIHQMELRGQAAGRVGHHHVDAARARRVHGVEDHRGRVAAFLLHDRHVVALAPDGELLARGGAERVAGGQQHALVEALQMLGELADAGGLARAVHARDHHDERLRAAQHQRLFERLEQVDQQLTQRGFHLLRFGQAFGAHLLAQRFEQIFGGVDTRVRHQQRGFQLLVEIVVDLRVDEDALDVRTRFRQARLQAREPRLLRGGVERGRRDDFDGLERAGGSGRCFEPCGRGRRARRRGRFVACGVGLGSRSGGFGLLVLRVLVAAESFEETEHDLWRGGIALPV
ncbi:hypothetical protein PT2222_10431 [Paraburkholderia tropica]